MQQNRTDAHVNLGSLWGHYTGTIIFNLYKLFLAHCDFCRLLITLVSSLNPNQDQYFVGSQFDTDVNNKGADQTVTRGDFCRLLITLTNRSDPDRDQQCRPKQSDTDVNNKERGPDCADSLFHKQ